MKIDVSTIGQEPGTQWVETGGQPPLRVGELTAAELVEWAAFEAQARPGLDLINCRDCRNRFGHTCNALRSTHVPLELNHRCQHYKPHRRSER